MLSLVEIKKEADSLPDEERAGLITYMLSSLEKSPMGPTDEEVDLRDIELDQGVVSPITFDQLIAQVGRE